MTVSSKRKWILRGVLILLLVGVSTLGFLAWRRNTSDVIWTRARVFLQSGDTVAAKVLLGRLLVRAPEHALGHLEMARLLLHAAQQQVPGATYDTESEARSHLEAAVSLAQDDPTVAPPVMAECVRHNLWGNVTKVASAVLQRDPKNADALFALATQSSKRGAYRSAQEYLDRLAGVAGEPRPRSLALQATVYDEQENRAGLHTVGERAARLAATPPEDLKPSEQAVLDRLLCDSIGWAGQLAEAAEWTTTALDWWEQRSDGELSELETLYLLRMTESLIAVRATAGSTDGRTDVQLWSRLATSLRQAADLRSAGPGRFAVLANVAMLQGNDERAVEIAREGIASLAAEAEPPQESITGLHQLAARLLVGQQKYRSAGEHIAAIKADRQDAGWGYLLSAQIALAEKRPDDAYRDLEIAVRRVGLRPAVRGTLIAYMMSIGAWREALSELDKLYVTANNPENLAERDRLWVEHALKDLDLLDLFRLRAHLALGEEEEARPVLDQLRQTEQRAQATAVWAEYLWSRDRRAEAISELAAAREDGSDDLPLAALLVQYLLQQERPQEAEAIVRQVAAQSPNDLGAHLLAVRWRLLQEDYRQAILQLDKTLALFPDEPQLVALKAQILLKAGRADEALALSEELQLDDGTQPLAGWLAAVAAAQLGEFSRAYQNMNLTGGLQKQHGEAYLLTANLAMVRNDYSAAVDAYSSAVSFRDSRSSAVGAMIAALRALADTEGVEAAEAKLQPILQRYPEEIAFWQCGAELQVWRGDYKAARETLQRLKTIPRGQTVAGVLLAKLWLASDRPAAALDEVQHVLMTDPSSDEARALAANLAVQLGRLDQALDHARQGQARHPENAVYSLVEAQVLRGRGDRDGAYGVLRREVSRPSHDAIVRVRMAEWLLEDQRGDEAVKLLGDAFRQISSDPQLVQSAVQLLCRHDSAAAGRLVDARVGHAATEQTAISLARAFIAGGCAPSAQQWARRALQLAEQQQGDVATAYALLGDASWLAASQQGNDRVLLDQARDDYAKAFEIDPDSIIVATAIVSLLSGPLDDWPEAIRVAEASLNTHPMHRVPTRMIDTLLNLYLQTGALEQADALLSRVLRARPLQRDWWVAKARLGYQLGRVEETLEEFFQGETQTGSSHVIAYARAQLWSMLDNPKLASSAAEQAVQLDPENAAARLLAARQQLQFKKYPAAIEHVNAVLKATIPNWEAHILRAEILHSQGDTRRLQGAVTDSLRQLSTAMAAAPQRADLYVTASELYQLADATDLALQILQSGLKRLPRDFELLRHTAQLFLDQGRSQAAEQLITRSLGTDLPLEQCLLLGQTFHRGGDLNTAGRWALRAAKLAVGRREEDSHMLLADIALDTGQATGDRRYFELARKHYNAVLNKFPNHTIAGNNLAWLLVKDLGEDDQALAVAERLRGSRRTEMLHPNFIGTLVRVYRKSGRLIEGEQLLVRALQLHPDRANLQLESGLMQVAQNDFDGAQRSLRRAIELGLDPAQQQEAMQWMQKLETAVN